MNTATTSKTLRPGLLVSLKTNISGNVKYFKQDLETDYKTESGALKARWQTERTIQNPEEHERGKVARGKCRSVVTAVCAMSEFGLLCLSSRSEELKAAISESRRIADEFNRSARQSRIGVYAVTGVIAADDAEAIRAVSSEVRDLLADMSEGVRNLDVAQIRAAANKARNIGQMLTPEAMERVQAAIDTARSAARKIAKAGDAAAIEVDRVAIARIEESRLAFLDTDAAESEIQEPVAESRAVDFEPESKPEWPDRAIVESYALPEQDAESDLDESPMAFPVVPVTVPQFDID